MAGAGDDTCGERLTDVPEDLVKQQLATGYWCRSGRLDPAFSGLLSLLSEPPPKLTCVQVRCGGAAGLMATVLNSEQSGAL